MADVVIEEVEDLDASWDAVIDLWGGQTDYHAPLLGFQPLPDWQTRLRERFNGGTDELVLLARVDGEAVGFLDAFIRRNPSMWEDTHCYIDNVFVREGVRGGGIGRALLKQAEAWSLSKGVVRLELVAVANNDLALAVWRQSGFSDASIRMSKTLEPSP
jgi:GNAT superfamily N-acetyltransferase